MKSLFSASQAEGRGFDPRFPLSEYQGFSLTRKEVKPLISFRQFLAP